MHDISISPGESAARRGYPWLLVGLLAVAVVFSYGDRLVLNLLIDPIRRDLHLTDTQFSVLQGASFGLVFACANPVLAWLSDRTSRRWILVGGMVLWSIATMSCGAASTYGQMLGARALIGLGEAALMPTGVALICEHFPPNRQAGAIGILLTAAGVGPGVGVLIGGVLLKYVEAGSIALPFLGATAPPWRTLLVLIGLPPSLIAVAVLLTVKAGSRGMRESTAPASDVAASKAPGLLLRPLVWGYVGASFYMIAQWAELSWVPALLTRRHGLHASTAGDVMGTVTIITGLLSPIIAVRLSNRLAGGFGLAGRFVAPAAGLLLAAVVSGCYLASNKYVMISGTFILDLSIFIAACAFIISLPHFLPARHMALATSLIYFLSGFLGLGAAPTLVAVATDRLYGNAAAVGESLTTVILPALVLAIVAFGAGIRSIRARERSA